MYYMWMIQRLANLSPHPPKQNINNKGYISDVVVSKIMSVKVFDSNSSCYQNKVTRCSVTIKYQRYKSSCQLTASELSSKMPKWSLLPISHLLLYSLLPSTKCSSPNQPSGGNTAAHVPPLPSFPGTILAVRCLLCWPCEQVTHKEGHCVQTLEFSDFIRPCLYQWSTGAGWGKDDYEDTQDKGLLLLWWQRIIGVIFPWGNCFKSKAGLVSPTLKPAYPLNSSPSVPSLLF